MPYLFKLTVANIRARKARFAFTATAVALGVAFMAGTLVLTATMSNAYRAISNEALEGTDALVQSTREQEDGELATVRGTVDDAVLTTVRAVPGVAAAEPNVEGIAQIVGPDGRLLDDDENRAVPVALAWQSDPELSPLELVDGAAPAAADEVVIDRATAATGSFAVGDAVRVITRAGPGDYTVAGIATYGGSDDAAGAPVLAFLPSTAADVLGEPGRYDSIAVRAGPGVNQAELTERIADALAGADDVEVITGDEAIAQAEAEAEASFGFMGVFLMAFAVVALLVGSFVIANTFSITVAQRTRETAVLRAIGATRRQVARAMRLEALVTGVLASAAGVVLGIGAAVGLRALLSAYGLDLPDGGIVVGGGIVATCIAVGTIVTVAAVMVPARRAAKVAPVAAMRGVAVDRSGRSVVRAVVGSALTLGGVVLLAQGLNGSGAGAVGLGSVVVFLGVSVLGPVIARPISRLLGAPLPRLRGVPGTMARENASRNPKRTAATASALMIGLGLVVFITVFGASTRASIADSVDDAALCDWIIDTTYGQGGISPEVGASIAALPEVGAISALRYTPATVDGTGSLVSAFDPAQIDQVVELDLVDGSVADMATDEVAVQADEAAAHGVDVGDVVNVEFAQTGSDELRVAAVYETDEPMGPYAMSIAGFDAHGVEAVDQYLFVTNADGVSMDEARAAMTPILRDYPTARLLTEEEFTQSMAAQINELLNLVYALLALAVLIALFGIANTLGLSVYERTRELGLLRAVGMARHQVRATVRWEAAIIALLGTALGTLVGLGFGWALVRALASEGFQHLSVPYGQLSVIVALATAAGVLAAVLPARKAARVEVLAALRGD